MARPIPGRDTRADWNFSAALELLNAPNLGKSNHELASPEPAQLIFPIDSRPQSASKLGDFPKLWDFLGYAHQSRPAGNTSSLLKPKKNQPALVYSSDGTVPSSSKHVTWLDETEASACAEDSVTQDEPSDAITDDTLSKKKKKKTSRPNKKTRERRKRAQNANAVKATSDVESESEILVWAKVSTKPTPAQQASAHAALDPGRASSKRTTPTKARSGAVVIKPESKTIMNASQTLPNPDDDEIVFTPLTKKLIPPNRTRNGPHRSVAVNGVEARQRPTLLLPAPPFTPPQPGRFFVEEKAVRDFQLRWKLMHEFPEDRRWLVAPVTKADHFHTKDPEGIHVIVDFSNISIGYAQKVSSLREKAKRLGERFNLSMSLSFDSLVLLLERGRPITKRVLGGSEHSLPAIEAAKAIGYEVNILDKVFKDRTLNEHQRRVAARRHSNPNHPNTFNSASNALHPVPIKNSLSTALPQHALPPPQAPSSPFSSPFAGGSEPAHPNSTPTPTKHNRNSYHAPNPVSAPEPGGKWVEQGVDEILHLKIAQSLLDSPTPSTFVVATGDAAEAEYSDGFLKMLERGLALGWRVELVGWRGAISGQYRKGAWVGMWGGRFRVVELDEWVEFLGI